MKWKEKTLFLLIFITQLYSNNSNEEKVTRFTQISFEHQTILQDNYTKLEWINGVDSNYTKDNNITIEDGCRSFDVNLENNDIVIRKKAQSYCKNLKFASYSDWRVPKDKEYRRLILAIKDNNLSIHYDSPSCINAIGLNDSRLNIVNTDIDSNSTGTITPFKRTDLTTCLRCVRDAEEPLAP